MLVVCDTNVWISGLVFPGGVPDRLIREIFAGTLKHATSPDITSEFKKKLITKFRYDASKANDLMSLLVSASTMVYPSERIQVVRLDESDNRIIECAVTAEADYLITGDKHHLLPLKTFRKVQIVSPREFFVAARLA